MRRQGAKNAFLTADRHASEVKPADPNAPQLIIGTTARDNIQGGRADDTLVVSGNVPTHHPPAPWSLDALTKIVVGGEVMDFDYATFSDDFSIEPLDQRVFVQPCDQCDRVRHFGERKCPPLRVNLRLPLRCV